MPPPEVRGRPFLKDGKPVTFETFKPDELAADPEVFQFRRQVNKAGTTGRLSGVTQWDPLASGKVVVFERLNGERVIADGHHRLELAKRLADQDPELSGYLFREADGWTPADVKAYAAKKNMIDSPRVDPVDAARVLRERPEILDGSVPVGDEVMRQARALSKLSDEAFDFVVGGVIPPNYAALVGDLVPDRSRHASMIAELAQAQPANAREARFMVGDLLQLPVHAEEQMTLLGALRVERSVLKERSKVLDTALKILRDDKRILAMLDREAGRIEEAGNRLAGDENAARAREADTVSALIEQLAAHRGPVSDWLTSAATSVAQGLPAKTAAEAFARRVADTLDREGINGLAIAREADLRAGGFDEPAGDEARLQVESLETELKPDIEDARHPEKVRERALLFALPPEREPTTARAGYGSEEDAASRRYVIDGREVVGRDRALMHLRGVAEAFAGASGAAAEWVATILIGPPGAGKSTVGGVIARLRRSAIVSADDAKPLLPEYGDGRGAALVHEESQHLANDVQRDLQIAGKNLILEKLGGSPESVTRLAAVLKEGGYSVDVVSVGAKRDVLLERIRSRAAKIGRTIPDEEVDATLAGITKTLKELKSDPRIRGVIEIDNGGDAPEIRSGKEFLGHDAEKAFSAAVRQSGVVRRDRNGRSDRGGGGSSGGTPGKGPKGRDDVDLAKFSDYFQNTGIDALARRNGATSILKLRPWSKHPGRVLAFHGTQAQFSRFDLGKAEDFGLHFGTADQANKFAEGRTNYKPGETRSPERGSVLPVVLDLKKVIDLPDLSRWHPRNMLKELEARGIGFPDELRTRIERASRVGDEPAYRLIREHLTKLGVDGIRYLNGAEGGGLTWSYIVWDPGKVRSATADDTLFALRSAQFAHTPAASRLMPDIRKEIVRTIGMLPDDVRVRVLDNLVMPEAGSRAVDGYWSGIDRIIYVSMTAGDPVNVVRHETIHALRQSGLLSDAEFNTLYDFAESGGLRASYNIDARYKDFYAKTYGHHLGSDGVEDLLREEVVAHMFGDYLHMGDRFGGAVDRIFDALYRFLERVRNLLIGRGFRDVRDVFQAIESGAVARRSMRQHELPGGGSIYGLKLAAIDAFHGSPHTFDPEPGHPAGRFRLDKIGTGEGAQAFGHGLYFAENEGVARSYRDNVGATSRNYLLDGEPINPRDQATYDALTSLWQYGPNLDDAISRIEADLRGGHPVDEYRAKSALPVLEEWKQNNRYSFAEPPGHLYQVRINANPEDFLDWDKPLSQQSERVRNALDSQGVRDAIESNFEIKDYGQGNIWVRGTGVSTKVGSLPEAEQLLAKLKKEIFAELNSLAPAALVKYHGTPQVMATALREAGIPGIKYLDQGSRGIGEGSRNYVVFDDSLIEITHVDGRPVANFAAELADADRVETMKKQSEVCARA